MESELSSFWEHITLFNVLKDYILHLTITFYFLFFWGGGGGGLFLFVWLFLGLEGTLSEQPCTGQVGLVKPCASTKDWLRPDAILDSVVCAEWEKKKTKQKWNKKKNG
jgi:hypothetical protein